MPLADFIFTDVQQRVLAATYLDPDAWHSFSDIKRATGSHGATQSFIRALLRAGALEDRFAGNQHQYRANREFPLYPEIRSICLKSFGLADRLRSALSPLSDHIEQAFIFGSIARHEDKPSSDIDLFVVGNVDLFELNAALAIAEKELGRPIHSNLYTAADLAATADDSVIKTIRNGPIISVIDHGTSADQSAEAGYSQAGGSKSRRRRTVSEER